jgi:pimeloyl-ACP methyl ester carboxylesterase
VTARFCLASRRLDRRIRRRDARLQVPALLLLAERDRIIDNARVVQIARRLQPEVSITTYRDAEHALVLERPDALAARILLRLRSLPC